MAIKLAAAASYTFISIYYPPGTAGAAQAYTLQFDLYWGTYLLATVAIFFSIEQIMKKVLTPLPGLSKLGVIVFRFTGILTLFIALTAHLSEWGSVPFYTWMQALCLSFGLCICVFEVSLMTLLIATARRLGLSFRTRIFGLSLGFCVLGIMDFVSLASSGQSTQAWAPLASISEVVVDCTLLMWCVYCILPEQKRGTLSLDRSSTLMRWNEIVSQLGIGPQPVADSIPSFMSDVESVVTRIMERNAAGNR